MRIVATAMAVAAGRSCFGPNCRPLDPFNVKVQMLGEMPEDEK